MVLRLEWNGSHPSDLAHLLDRAALMTLMPWIQVTPGFIYPFFVLRNTLAYHPPLNNFSCHRVWLPVDLCGHRNMHSCHWCHSDHTIGHLFFSDT